MRRQLILARNLGLSLSLALAAPVFAQNIVPPLTHHGSGATNGAAPEGGTANNGTGTTGTIVPGTNANTATGTSGGTAAINGTASSAEPVTMGAGQRANRSGSGGAWGWIGLVGLFGLVGLKSENDTRSRRMD